MASSVARARLDRTGQSTAAATVTWKVTDVLACRPTRRYRLWHDRAVFHFLTNPADRATYRDLAAAFAPQFTARLSDDEQHHTPWGAVQHFTWLVGQRVL